VTGREKVNLKDSKRAERVQALEKVYQQNTTSVCIENRYLEMSNRNEDIIINYMGQSPSSEASSCSAGQEFQRRLSNSKIMTVKMLITFRPIINVLD
jgi:hypothetical protein